MVTDRLQFDNEFYYTKYPDVLEAVKDGAFRNGEDHYKKHGKAEGREVNYKSELEIVIDKSNKGWSNHLTLKGYKEPEKIHIPLNMVEVPEMFQPVQKVEYPIGNKTPFERYFTEKYKELKPNTFRHYLPIHWTAYYVNNGYGKDKGELQSYLETLDRNLKYFTVVQYDDGILEDLSSIDCLVYASGCKKPGYYPIPLLSQPINNNPQTQIDKDILISFSGANTHPIRERMVKAIDNPFVKLESMPIKQYYDILKRSIFALCPRGYGVTSFRMFEAMAFGCIPIYVSDEFWEPFNLPFEYSIKVHESEIDNITEMLEGINIEEMQAKVKYYYENYFVYSQAVNTIFKTLTI